MKRLLVLLMALFLVACGTDEAQQEPDKEEQPEEEQTEKVEETEEPEAAEVEQEEVFDKEIDVDDELLFAEFTVTMNKVHVYEEDGKAFADISFDWINQAGDGKKMFMQIAALDVTQGDNILKETTGAWDIENKNSSDVYFPNAQNGEWKVDLTYELENTEEPITITFVPLTGEESESITININ